MGRLNDDMMKKALYQSRTSGGKERHALLQSVSKQQYEPMRRTAGTRCFTKVSSKHVTNAKVCKGPQRLRRRGCKRNVVIISGFHVQPQGGVSGAETTQIRCMALPTSELVMQAMGTG
jgi:hypothetical protein